MNPPVTARRQVASLSIIIPTLNEAHIIEASLARLQGLRDAGAELVVVDGGSEDSTQERAVLLASRVIESPPGRSHQMNAGTDVARGNLLVFLHADTHLPEGADALIQRALSGESCWGRFDIRLEGHHPMLPVIAFAMNQRSRLTGLATGDQAMFMTRVAFETIGGFPDQPLMEDIEMSRRLKRLTPPACLGAKVTSSGRRWERNGVWRTIRLMWRLRYRYWRGVSADILVREYRHVR